MRRERTGKESKRCSPLSVRKQGTTRFLVRSRLLRSDPDSRAFPLLLYICIHVHRSDRYEWVSRSRSRETRRASRFVRVRKRVVKRLSIERIVLSSETMRAEHEEEGSREKRILLLLLLLLLLLSSSLGIFHRFDFQPIPRRG